VLPMNGAAPSQRRMTGSPFSKTTSASEISLLVAAMCRAGRGAGCFRAGRGYCLVDAVVILAGQGSGAVPQVCIVVGAASQ
jgi:hypothetical protein